VYLSLTIIIINYYCNQEWMIYQRKKISNSLPVTALSAIWSAPQLNRIDRRKSSKNRKHARGRYTLTRWHIELYRWRSVVDRFWSVGRLGPQTCLITCYCNVYMFAVEPNWRCCGTPETVRVVMPPENRRRTSVRRRRT